MSFEIVLIGFVVGVLIGVTGVGGASLLTPILIFMGIQPTIAIGTDFFYNVVTKAVGAFQHMKQKTVNFELVKFTALGSIPAAVITNLLFYVFLIDYFPERLLLIILGLVLVSTSFLSLMQLIFRKKDRHHQVTSFYRSRRKLVFIGILIGVVVGLTSVGGGSLFAIFILYLFPIKSSELVGSDITHAFLLTFITALLMASYGNIDYILAFNLLCGSIPGTILGSKLTLRLPATFIRIFIVLIIFISGIQLIN